MHSSAWMNGQHQQVGPALQAATQHTYYTMRNQQTGSPNNFCQYRTVNMGVQPPQSANFIFHDGNNRQMSNWQTSVASHQTASFPQPTQGKSNNYLKFLQNSAIYAQAGNPSLPFSNGFQVATQQHFHHSSALNSSTQSPPGMMKANTTYPQRDMPPYWNQPVNGKQSISTQDGNIVSDLQHYRVQEIVHQNVNRESMKPISAYPTTGTSLLHEQAVCTSSLVSATAHNRQTVHTQNPKQNSIKDGLYSSSPPSYSAAVLQSYRNNSKTANSLSSRLMFHGSSLNQKTQQYAPQLNTMHYTGGEATSAVNSNSQSRQYEINHFPSKVNEMPVNYTSEIVRLVDSLENSYTAESNGTMPPVTSTVVQTWNSNTSQPLHFRQSLPKTAQSVTSVEQRIVNMPPQQKSIADGFYVTTIGDGSRNSNKVDSALSNRNLVGCSHDASHLMQMRESISPQKNKSQSLVANNHEILEALTSVKQSDSSIHSSPGHTGPRAVAVVQPLSQESHQVGSKPSSSNTSNQLGECTTTNKSLNNPDKLCILPDVAKKQNAAYLREGFNDCTENANQMRSSEFLIKHSTASSDGTVVPSSKSSGPQRLLEKLLLADDKDAQLAIIRQAHWRDATASQQSVTSEVPVSQNSNKDKSEMPTDLSSIPTTPWTIVMLTNLIRDEEKSHMALEDNAKFESATKLLNMFWDDNHKLLVFKLKKDWYKILITDVLEFCDKHVTTDSIVLSQVKHGFGKILENYYVLKDEEVYSEPLYKSSWLNVNQQVDDIDKEFGFPWSLKHRLNTFETGSQPDQHGTVNSVPAKIVSEVPNDLLSKTELESVGSGEEKQTSALVTTSNQTFSPNKTDSADSDDPYYSFEIQVLPPEEAKVVFDQVQSKMPQSMDMDSQPEEVMNSSEEGEIREVTNVTLRESKPENTSVSPIEEVCCIARLMEIMGGSKMPSLSKCQCKKEQSHTDCADKIPDKEASTTQKNDNLCSITSDTKFHSATKEETQANGGENNNSHIIFSSPELCNELSQTSNLSDGDNKPQFYFAKDQKNISHMSINDSYNIDISENEDKEMKSAGSSPSRHSDNKKEIQKVSSSEVAIQMSDDEEDCAQAELTSTDLTESSFESQEEKTQTSATSALQTAFKLSGKCRTAERKRKTLRSIDRVFPNVNKSKKCKLSVDLDSQPAFKGVDTKEDFVEAPGSESPAENVRTVELVLFGSASQEKCVSVGSRRSPISSAKALSNAALMAPKVLSLNVSPLRSKDSVSSGAYSLKQRIHEEWRRSFPPTKIRQRGKLKTLKCTFASLSGVSLKKAETTGSTNPTEPPVSSEMRTWNENTKCCLSLKRWRSLSSGVNIREDKTKKYPVTLKRPSDEERSNAGSGGCAVMSPQNKIVLKFSMSPNNFKYGSSGRKETAHPVSGKP